MAEDEALSDVLQRVVGEAIEQAVAEHEKGFVLRWVAFVESSDPEGQRGVWGMASPETKAWDTLGLLQYGIAIEQAAIVTDRLSDG